MAASEPNIPQTTPGEFLREHKRLFQALAIAWAVLGVLAVLAPLAAGVAVVLIVAWLLLRGGSAQLIHAFRVRPWTGTLRTLALRARC